MAGLRASGTPVTNSVASTTLSLPYPAGMTSSDVMVMFASVNSGSVNGASLPAGWTQVFRTSNTAGTLPPHLMVAIKQATGSESGNLAVTTASAKSTGQIDAFTGINLTTLQDVVATFVDQTSAAVATLDIPTLTTTRPGCVLVYAAAHNNGAETATAPSSPAAFTETGDNSGTGGWAGTMGYLIWASSGATGTVQVTFSGSNRGIGVLLALRALDEFSSVPLTSGAATISTSAAGTRPASVTTTSTAATTTGTAVSRPASVTASATATTSTDTAASRIMTPSVAGVASTTTDTTVARDVTMARTATAFVTGNVAADRAASGDVAAAATTASAAVIIRPVSGDVSAAATIDADATVTPGNRLKLWDGAAWTAAPVKVWDGAAWTTAPTKHYDGATWTI